MAAMMAWAGSRYRLLDTDALNGVAFSKTGSRRRSLAVITQGENK